jgi:hypothetical protein
MTTTAPHNGHDTTPERVLFVAFERSEKTWKLGFTTGHGQKPRERSIAACHQAHVLHEVAQAQKRIGLPDTAPVVSCYEAPSKPPQPGWQPVPSHPSCPCPAARGGPGGAGRLGHALVGYAPGWAARGVRADARRGHQREQGGRGWADAVGGKGRSIFLYSSPRGNHWRPTAFGPRPAVCERERDAFTRFTGTHRNTTRHRPALHSLMESVRFREVDLCLGLH